MTKQELIEGINNLQENSARNSMSCSENWYNFFFAMRETFTPEEIDDLSDRECDLLYKLAQNIQDGLY